MSVLNDSASYPRGGSYGRRRAAYIADGAVGIQAQTQGPGWGYGWVVLSDASKSDSPQGQGTLQWGGVYGHYWFVDPIKKLTVVSLTNTAFEGMSGTFPFAVRVPSTPRWKRRSEMQWRPPLHERRSQRRLPLSVAFKKWGDAKGRGSFPSPQNLEARVLLKRPKRPRITQLRPYRRRCTSTPPQTSLLGAYPRAVRVQQGARQSCHRDDQSKCFHR